MEALMQALQADRRTSSRRYVRLIRQQAVASRIILLVGVATAAVARVGHWTDQHVKCRETTTQIYTEALQAIHHYEELLYAIRHRQRSDSEVRAALAEKTSDVFARTNYHQTLLTMDFPLVGEACAALFARTRR